ncbi:permease-like cell division protein FtsX [Sphaerisporangium fuscum]|uniref:permease-like cell division protein FtsX n=1 Tax=Sphaerisporangium fuscum TaxID=2835868 RepID=UPI001BDC3AB4|nr:permease-like cell division protein FtsX [Sphaerisporangium fuscum]
MDTPEGSSGTEELSFGGDPDREPRLRRWVTAHRRLLAVGAAIVVALALAGGGGTYLYLQSRKPLPPPDAALPEQLRFRVYFGHGGEVPDAVRAIPGVASVKVVGKEEQYREALKAYEEDPEAHTKPLDRTHFSDRLDGTLRRSADYPAVEARLRHVPGVLDVRREITDFWSGKADVSVYLCGAGPGELCTSFRTGPIAEQPKQAILDRLRGIDGVEKIYFEDKAFALKLMKRYFPEGVDGDTGIPSSAVRESFRLRIGRPDGYKLVRQAVDTMPGVLEVTRVE